VSARAGTGRAVAAFLRRRAVTTTWARRGRRLYGQWIRPGSLCFDIGANVGDRSLIFLSLGAQVVAVEPQRECVAALRKIAARNDRLIVEPLAVAAAAGVARMHISTPNTLSSMADGWIERVRESGRFGNVWSETRSVQTTTLDALIDRYGVPDFCKIDVEGYEPEVVAGLSQPLPLTSFEFTPEWAEAAEQTIEHLVALGVRRFNFSLGETLSLAWPEWRDFGSLLSQLRRLPMDGRLFGDIYAAA
jgi:FkbM family methyltransferase